MQRLLSGFLVLCMLLACLFPLPAYAQDKQQENSTATSASHADDPIVADKEQAKAKEDSDDNNTGTDESGVTAYTSDGCDVTIRALGGVVVEYYTIIRLTAIDENTKKPIEGVCYEICRMSDGQFLESIVTDKEGLATSKELPLYEDYIVVETSVPEEYEQQDNVIEVRLTEECNPALVNITVEYVRKRGAIEILKVDEDGIPIEGIEFTIHGIEDMWGYEDVAVTDMDGMACFFDLSFGSYVITETSCPPEYWALQPFDAHVDQENPIRIELINEFRKGDIEINKKSIDGRPIEGQNSK